MKRLLTILLLLILSSCTSDKLTIYTTYITPERRASFHVFTPDPKLNCPDVGQRMYIKWNIPQEWMNSGDLRLHLVIRFRNREQVEEWIDIEKSRGMAIYELYNDDYFRTCGILTYKADLLSCDQILLEWRHQIWAEWIDIQIDECPEEQELFDLDDEIPE